MVKVTVTVVTAGNVSNLMFYAQSTSAVISGRSKVSSMETETLKSGHGGENEVIDCKPQLRSPSNGSAPCGMNRVLLN